MKQLDIREISLNPITRIREISHEGEIVSQEGTLRFYSYFKYIPDYFNFIEGRERT